MQKISIHSTFNTLIKKTNTTIPQTVLKFFTKTYITANKFYSTFVNQSKYYLHRHLDPPNVYTTA